MLRTLFLLQHKGIRRITRQLETRQTGWACSSMLANARSCILAIERCSPEIQDEWIGADGNRGGSEHWGLNKQKLKIMDQITIKTPNPKCRFVFTGV